MKYWLVSWDCLGVEHLEEITEHHPDRWARDHLFDSIKDSKVVAKKMSIPLGALLLRARYNSHRHYEIYVFTSEDSIDAEGIKSWFDTDAQGFADWVRKNHSVRLWDDRQKSNAVIV